MYQEQASLRGATDLEQMALNLCATEKTDLRMTGESIDRIFKNGVLVDEIHGHNIVVNSMLNLVMCLFKQQSGYKGLQYWAIGSGASSWDTTSVSPEITATRLTKEIGRVALDDSCFSFLTPEYGVSQTPTNILQIKKSFGENDCNGEWREFGIFGGNATSSANSGILINKRHHKIITKTSEMTVERTMRFVLNLV